jgi:hypothetical protein
MNTNQKINKSRKNYRPVAWREEVINVPTQEMPMVNPMY